MMIMMTIWETATRTIIFYIVQQHGNVAALEPQCS